MPKIEPFEENASGYEDWFEEHSYAYESEILAVERLIPRSGRGLEIGVGTGRFAARLGIDVGVEPSPEMRRRARKRGLQVHDGVAENLPFPSGSFDYALMVTTVCFVDDVEAAFKEACRVLRPEGVLVVGFVDLASPLGRVYQAHKGENPFYRDATFYSAEQVLGLLAASGFEPIRVVQTVFGKLASITSVQEPRDGHGEGGFVVLSGRSKAGPGKQRRART